MTETELPAGYRWVTFEEITKVVHPSRYIYDDRFAEYFKTHAILVNGYYALPVWI